MVTGTILVMGATGTTGTYLVDQLVEEGYDVFAVGHRNVNDRYYQKRGIRCASVDTTNKEDFDVLPKDGVHTVVLLSGLMPARMKGYEPQRYIDVNISGTLNVLEYCNATGVPRVVFAHSHSDVAGHWNTGRYIKDDDDRIQTYRGDHAVYILSKNAAVELIRHYHVAHGIQHIILRMPTIYCYEPSFAIYVDGDEHPIAYRLLIKKALAGEPVEIWGDPKVPKDIVYVKDFVQIVIGAINNDRASGIYNVGTGIPTTLEEQIQGIVAVFNDPDNPSQIVYRPDKPSQVSYLYDISRAKEDLEYRVEYRYLAMLEDMKKEMAGHRFDHWT